MEYTVFMLEEYISTSTLVVALFYIATISAIITVAFARRREPATRFAWIVVLVFIPMVGIGLFLLFGRGYTRQERVKMSEETACEVQDYLDRQMESARYMDFASPRYIQLARMNISGAHSPLTADNSVEIFPAGEEKFRRLMEDIRNARCYIHMLYFIFRTDELGEELLDLLTQKAAEGLDVKLVYDDMGNIAVSRRGFKKLSEAGGRVFQYSPLVTSWFSANYRNHRKLVIIDDSIGYIGGMNVGAEYVKGRGKLTPWRDTHARIEGSAVHVMESVFLPDYVYAAHKKEPLEDLSRCFDLSRDFSGSSTVQILASSPQGSHDSAHIHRSYLKMISAAQDYLYIQSPYLIPDSPVRDALGVAAASGVDVRIMIPLHPDKRLVYMASLSYAEALCGLGVKIYLYDGFIHSKTVLVDDEVFSVGSANMDVRSFFLSFEANAVIYDRAVAAAQRQQFHADMEHSRLADAAYFAGLSPRVKFMMPLCQLFSPLL